MLSINNLHASVAGKEILRGLNLEVKPGEVHAIMGPNGSGKSTLANVIAGRDGYEVTAGEVIFNGKPLLELAPEERAGEGIFLAFQYPVEIPGVAMMNFLKAAMNSQRKARNLLKRSVPDVIVAEYIFQSDFRDRTSNLETLMAVLQRHPSVKVVVFHLPEQADKLAALEARFRLFAKLPLPVSSEAVESVLREALTLPAGGA